MKYTAEQLLAVADYHIEAMGYDLETAVLLIEEDVVSQGLPVLVIGKGDEYQKFYPWAFKAFDELVGYIDKVNEYYNE